MTKLPAIFGAAAALLASLSTAHAQTAPLFNWSGFYAGVDAGQIAARTYMTLAGVSDANPESDGLVAGFHFGQRWQSSAWVTGWEADIWGSNADNGFSRFDGFTNFAHMRVRWGGSLRAVGGYAAGSTLFYVTGGGSYIHFRSCIDDGIGTPCNTGAVFNDGRFGWTAGGGIAHAFSPQWIARLEVLYADYGTKNYPVVFTPTVLNHDLRTTTVRGGLSWRFGS